MDEVAGYGLGLDLIFEVHTIFTKKIFPPENYRQFWKRAAPKRI